VLLATKVLVGFLRGLLTNLDTPPVASHIRSILVRPPKCQRSRNHALAQTLPLFVVPTSDCRDTLRRVTELANLSSSPTAPRTTRPEFVAGGRSSAAATSGQGVVSNLRVSRCRLCLGTARALVQTPPGQATWPIFRVGAP
jgi:hypothetical protein